MPYSSSLSGSVKPNKVESTQADGRSFEEIRQDCLRRGILFEDPDFPAADDSLFYSQSVPINFEWKRPKVCLLVTCGPLLWRDRTVSLKLGFNLLAA